MKKTKKFLGILAVLIVSAVVVGASVLTYFSTIETTVNIEALVEISTDEGVTWDDAEGFDIVSINGCTYAGENNEAHEFLLRSNVNADYDPVVYFHITDEEGFTTSVFDFGTSTNVTEMTLVRGAEPTELAFQIAWDEMVASGAYIITLTIDNTP